MLTTDGKYQIKRFMATQVPQIARAISFGIGETPATVNDKRLKFELARVPVRMVSYDHNADKLIFKAALPDALEGRIIELGLWSEMDNAVNAGFSDRLLVTMDSGDEQWSGTPLWSSSTTRIGEDSLRQAPGAGATSSNEITALGQDLSGYSSADIFSIAYNNLNTNTSSVQVRFKSDDTNYYSYTATNPTAGYHFDEVAKGSFVVTGSPNWGAIEKIEVITVAKAGLAAQVDYDGIGIIDVDTVNPNYVMVARNVLATPFNVVAGSVNEVEFTLSVNIV